MDRESDTEEVENRNHERTMEESDEDTDTEDQALFGEKINHEMDAGGKRDQAIKEEVMESAAEEIRRMYENSAAGGQHRLIPPVAHRSAATASNNNANIISSIGNFANFNPQQLANEQLLQYTIVNYLQQQQQQQQQAAAANSGGAYQQLPQSASSATSHYGALPPSMQSAALLMQQSMAVAAAATAANSFQSSVPRPPSRLSSPHLHSGGMSLSQKRQASSPLNSYRSRSPTNFQSPPPAHSRRSASVSSRQSREESTSPVAQSSWSFEEQFKQLYDIDKDDPKRKEFLDDLFSFMQKHGSPVRESYSKNNSNIHSQQSLAKSGLRMTSQQDIARQSTTQVIYSPVTRLPIMAKSVLDLYELYKLVVQRGGLVDVINKKLWQEVIKGLNLPSSITSAAFTLRTQYMKFLYRYECAKLNLSSMTELHAAIEGNKREGRRTSYPYGELGGGHGQSPNHHNQSSSQPHHHHHHHQQQQSHHHSGGNANSLLSANGPLHHLISPPTSLLQSHQQQHQSSRISSPVGNLISSSRPSQLNGHGGGVHTIPPFGGSSANASILSHVAAANSGVNSAIPSSIPNAHYMPPAMLQDLSDPNVINNLDVTQLALWNFYNGVVKTPHQVNSLSTFQDAVSRAVHHQKASSVTNGGDGCNNNIEAPLDLGKRRAADTIHSLSNSSVPPAKREALNNDDGDDDDDDDDEDDNRRNRENEDGDETSSISDGESNDDRRRSSSQERHSPPDTTNPVSVEMNINGIKYRGVLHPITNSRTI